MKHRALVFDFFGVLCSEVAPYWLAQHLSENAAALVKSTIVHAADRGDISQQDLFGELAKLTHQTATQIEEDWLGRAKIDRQMMKLVEDIRSRCQLALLTNSPSRFFRRLTAEHSVDRLFDVVIVSSEVGRAKPEKEIYQLVLNRLNVQASDSLMIDDNPINVEAALEIGMNATIFKSIQDLKDVIGY